MILLDTCTLLWLVMDHSHLSPIALKTMEKNAGRLSVSAITAFEIGLKAERGKLELPFPVQVWFKKAVQLHGILEFPVTSAIALTASALPPVHNDPFDRLIIATALEHGAALLTPDPMIKKYPEVKTLW